MSTTGVQIISAKALGYEFWKNNVISETYIALLEKKHWCLLLHGRLSNHNLPIETGRWKLYYYKIEYVYYVAIVISEMNFITFLPGCSLSPTHRFYKLFN